MITFRNLFGANSCGYVATSVKHKAQFVRAAPSIHLPILPPGQKASCADNVGGVGVPPLRFGNLIESWPLWQGTGMIARRPVRIGQTDSLDEGYSTATFSELPTYVKTRYSCLFVLTPG